VFHQNINPKDLAMRPQFRLVASSSSEEDSSSDDEASHVDEDNIVTDLHGHFMSFYFFFCQKKMSFSPTSSPLIFFAKVFMTPALMSPVSRQVL